MPFKTNEARQAYNKLYYQKNRKPPKQREVKSSKDMKEYQKAYYHANKEKMKEYNKEYKKKHKDEMDATKMFPYVKKINRLYSWEKQGLIATTEDIDRIYDLSINQKVCNACDRPFKRDGKMCKRDPCMDHSHETGLFRHIICRSCNGDDKWKKYFC